MYVHRNYQLFSSRYTSFNFGWCLSPMFQMPVVIMCTWLIPFCMCECEMFDKPLDSPMILQFIFASFFFVVVYIFVCCVKKICVGKGLCNLSSYLMWKSFNLPTAAAFIHWLPYICDIGSNVILEHKWTPMYDWNALETRICSWEAFRQCEKMML